MVVNRPLTQRRDLYWHFSELVHYGARSVWSTQS
uniref:Uncharacterized protein n=1 Tax=Anguilla anguilla TaxID=7936 RepID=A0A0E9TR74_ANGAN